MTIDIPSPERIENQDETTQFLIRRSSLGDGYTVKAPEGINNTRESITVSWVRTRASEARTLFDTLKNTGGFEPIRFTLRDSTEQKQYVITNLTKNFSDPVNQIVTATLEEDFSP